MTTDAWFPCYPADLTSNTARLRPHDFGAYWRLLCDYYQNGPLPNDPEDLRNISGVESSDWMRTWGKLEQFFYLGADGKWHQKRADEVILERNAITSRRRAQTEAARAANPKHHPVTNPVTNPVTEPVTGVHLQPQLQSQVQPQPQPVPPIPPKGDRVLELKGMVNRWFKRRETTNWSEKESKKLAEVVKLGTSPEDIALLDAYYSAAMPAAKDYRRRDIPTLLNNWNGEIDRARRWNGTASGPESRERKENLTAPLL